MNGSDIGQLSVIVQRIGGVGDTGEHLKWRLSGNQGNMWRKASVPIGTAVHTCSYYRVSIRTFCTCKGHHEPFLHILLMSVSYDKSNVISMYICIVVVSIGS